MSVLSHFYDINEVDKIFSLKMFVAVVVMHYFYPLKIKLIIIITSNKYFNCSGLFLDCGWVSLFK